MSETILRWWESIKEFFYSIALSIKEMFGDLFIWVFDSLLAIVALVLGGISMSLDTLNVTQYINAIPPDVKNVMALAGIDTAMSMITASILIRLTLQIIPFVRLGS